MRVIVQKFGGTSLDGPERLSWVADQVIEAKRSGFAVVVVASAPAGMTSDLLARCLEIDEHPARRELDMLLSVGEGVSIALLAMTLSRRGVAAVSLTGGQAGIFTNGDHGRARITEIRSGRIRKELRAGRVVVPLLRPDYPLVRFGAGDLSGWMLGPDGSLRLRGVLGRSGAAVKVKGMFLHPRPVAAARSVFPSMASSTRRVSVGSSNSDHQRASETLS